MNSETYEKLQAELSQLLSTEKYKHMTTKNKDIYKQAVLACKSVISHYKMNLEAELVQCDEWNVLEGKLGEYATLHCKKCGTTFNDVSSWKYHYCPNCGAKM